jgi:hypothetical protein
MNRRVTRRLEMGARALEFSKAHPVDSPGYATAVQQLEEQLARADQLGMEQERGTTEVHAATARKVELKRSIRWSQLVHLAGVAGRAAREVPELLQKFDLPRVPHRNLGFSTVARTMFEEAQRHKDMLIKHGLVEQMLDALGQSLDQFDEVVQHGAEGRRVHIGARANLEVVADEVVQLVKILDGYNRHRFTAQPELLAAWVAARNIRAADRRTDGETDARTGGETDGAISPAA